MEVHFFSILVGLVGVLMSLSYFPQAMKIIKRKSSKDVSLITFSVFSVGTFLWLIYGFILGELPIILGYLVGFIGTTSVLILAIKYR